MHTPLYPMDIGGLCIVPDCRERVTPVRGAARLLNAAGQLHHCESQLPGRKSFLVEKAL